MRRTTRIAAAVKLALLLGAAHAQVHAAAAASDGLEDIIVTATRQSTNLQDTPIAITAVTSDSLEERGLTTIAELTSVVPNAQFRRVQGAFGPGVSAFIRGIGSTDTGLGGEVPVAFYIDDVYYPILLGANFDLLDIDHIEVLRGPQGTLFGRNSLAGALNIVGQLPSTAETSGYAEMTVGAFNRRDLRAGVNLPLSDTVAVKLSGLSKRRDGFQKRLDFTCEMTRRGTPQLAGSFPTADVLATKTPNYTPNDCVIGRLGGEDVNGGRVSFLWEASPATKFVLSGDYIHDLSENTADSIVDVDPTRVSNNLRTEAAYFGLVVDRRFMTGSPYSTYVTYADRIPAGTVVPGNSYYNGTRVNGRPTRGGYELPLHTDVTSWGVSGKMLWDLGRDMNLTAVVGYRSLNDIHTFDTDGMPLVVEHVINNIKNDYLNAEVRLSGKSRFIDWVGGVFYFDAEGTQHASLVQASTGGQRALYTTYDPTSKAVFANATIRPFGDRWSFVVGGRYSDDQKVVNFSNIADVSPSPSDIRFRVVPQQNKASWKLGTNFQLNDETLIYASAATGNTLPGYNPRPLQTTQVFQFDGNDSIAYELGAKVDLWDRRVRLNGAAFYTDFRNRPTAIGGAEATLDVNNQPVAGNQLLDPLPGGPPGSTRCSTRTVTNNSGIVCIGRTYYRNQPATVKGLELEYTVTPVRALVFNGSVGWSRFWSPDIAARTVNRRQGNPFWTANAGVQYEFAANALGGSLVPRLDWTYESNQIVSATSTKYNDLMPARSLFNARLSYDNTEHEYSVALGVTNLTGKEYYVNVFDYQGLGYPQTDAQPGRPREWSLTLKKRF